MHKSTLLIPVFALAIGAGHLAAEAQESENGVRYGDAVVQDWKFGLVITAGNGNVSGINATVPVLTDWPEQQVEEIGRDVSKSVKRVSFSDLRGVKQMRISIPRLRAGESAEAVIRYRVTKKSIEEPADTSSFRALSTVPGPIKQFLSPSPYIESAHSSIRDVAPEIVLDKKSAWDQTQAIYDWVRENVTYKFDPQIKSATTALALGEGDCEEMTSLFIALCRANKIPARMVWVPQHCYPEFYLTGPKGKGHWIPCQVAGSPAFGRMQEERPILQKGDKFRVPGESKPIRYVAPTLTAKDAAASPQVKWVMERIQ